mmetsp:Transcript_21974/g.61095  ORF Transcript_21974/g.61095 Transcript_21974/m.61095 type:complete len:206 (-) Transcript_21974:392-1009(-)
MSLNHFVHNFFGLLRQGIGTNRILFGILTIREQGQNQCIVAIYIDFPIFVSKILVALSKEPQVLLDFVDPPIERQRSKETCPCVGVGTKLRLGIVVIIVFRECSALTQKSLEQFLGLVGLTHDPISPNHFVVDCQIRFQIDVLGADFVFKSIQEIFQLLNIPSLRIALHQYGVGFQVRLGYSVVVALFQTLLNLAFNSRDPILPV